MDASQRKAVDVVLSARALNETRFQFYHANISNLSESRSPRLDALNSFIGGGAQAGNSFNTLNTYELQNYTNLSQRAHTLHFGVRAATLDNTSPINFGGTFTFAGRVAPELNADNQPVLGPLAQANLVSIDSIESYGHEKTDAETWASLGIDYLKYDRCSASRIWRDEDMRAVYQRMGEALQKSGRPIVFSLCQYGRANAEERGPKVGGNLWRTTGDISDNWDSMRIGFAQSDLGRAGPGHWNDPDMLEVGNGGTSLNEYRIHFSLWAMLAAPLIASNDLRHMSPDVRELLTNTEVIAIDQDRLGRAG